MFDTTNLSLEARTNLTALLLGATIVVVGAIFRIPSFVENNAQPVFGLAFMSSLIFKFGSIHAFVMHTIFPDHDDSQPKETMNNQEEPTTKNETTAAFVSPAAKEASIPNHDIPTTHYQPNDIMNQPIKEAPVYNIPVAKKVVSTTPNKLIKKEKREAAIKRAKESMKRDKERVEAVLAKKHIS
ncbi:unnamed protein product [Cylindrotheca closterium]|uniref:Uncharacterized protein n=1 Tax=Cylindrotheca closterium TaxID=2856 RepID=A0AAD2CRZ5_9STRA|nr:unnamed protein product [Cylindrotheca closterium]